MKHQPLLKRYAKALSTVLIPESLRVVGYPIARGRPPVNPFYIRTFNDLLNQKKLRERYAEVCFTQDKLLAKDWVSVKAPDIGIPKTLAVYETAGQLKDAISKGEIPSLCIIKTNHGAGFNYIFDKERAEPSETISKKFSYATAEPYNKSPVEWAYFYVNPKIYCEELLSDSNTQTPPPDYKVFVFNGTPKMIQVDVDRFIDHKRCLFDTSWNLLNVEYEYPMPEKSPKKPCSLDRILDAASKIARPFTFCRVDFYVVDGHPFFGEMSHYPEGGYGRFNPRSFNRELYLKGFTDAAFEGIYYA
ncbi:ATP-grasp fold amidoligase family protein [Halorhodospira sp. 9622]|uniref:ATP-grasp fold amidoligase family protein n=1 Tax=Halorhodospira sp. 9622 TaxID=2899136 RepID=UPI001EE95848|nr:ATP-grasp fold amidoligase family protein [Halorhodospira sp. 9622]MCG5539100.1 hypothetical protein [Halorhodospira sp. 9622]